MQYNLETLSESPPLIRKGYLNNRCPTIFHQLFHESIRSFDLMVFVNSNHWDELEKDAAMKTGMGKNGNKHVRITFQYHLSAPQHSPSIYMNSVVKCESSSQLNSTTNPRPVSANFVPRSWPWQWLPVPRPSSPHPTNNPSFQ